MHEPWSWGWANNSFKNCQRCIWDPPPPRLDGTLPELDEAWDDAVGESAGSSSSSSAQKIDKLN